MGDVQPSDWVDLDRALDRALGPVAAASGPTVVLFSGGVDSGLLAWELRASPSTSLFTIGRPGADDLGAGRAAAPLVGLPWSGRPLGDDELLAVDRTAAAELLQVDRPRRGIFVALAAAFAYAPPGVLVCGQGADELFLGYAHFRGLPVAEAAARAAADLDLLRGTDWPRTERLAALWGRRVVAPFLEPAFVATATAVPVNERLPHPSAKAYFRRWASHRGLPPALVDRPKRAVQYGSGVDRWLRRHGRGVG